jgi:hypothetical protein
LKNRLVRGTHASTLLEASRRLFERDSSCPVGRELPALLAIPARAG